MYKIYATLLDTFQGYLDSSELWQEYWGFSEDPSKTEEEFEREQFQSVIDRINRVPFDSEAEDRGTAFNEVVDCIIDHRVSEKMDIKSNHEDNTITVAYNGRTFVFPLKDTAIYARLFTGAITQLYTEAILPTKHGDVLLYGYIDELMPHSVHDIKTTSKYKAGKFRKHWQKVVYPYCLNENGNMVYDFEYNVVLFDRSGGFTTFDEYYRYNEKAKEALRSHVEAFIEFIELNKDLITDQKIFGHDPTV